MSLAPSNLYCFRCQKCQPTRMVSEATYTRWLCDVCGWELDCDFEDDDYGEDVGHCPDCGGDGLAEYQDHPEAWGEDCPSLVNHLITCPNCGGSGMLRDCKYG